MARLVTVSWEATVKVDDGFDPINDNHLGRVQEEAWSQVQRGDGVIVDDYEEPPNTDPQ